MGDWIFYTCVMRLADIAHRVSFADEIHRNKELSKLIQREIKEGRQDEIKDYLLKDGERFFGSLVIAVYGGDPNWHEIGVTRTSEHSVPDLDENRDSNLGFLSLSGEEQLFALDGQHRLAGIKAAVKEREELGKECVSVVFVGHSNTEGGLRRTRKLFTALNKNAKPTTKSEIIALDENDLMAIVTRRLVEEYTPFMGHTIAYNKGTSISKSEKYALTNIVNVYDLVSILVARVFTKIPVTKWREGLRPSEEQIDDLYGKTILLLEKFINGFPELKKYFSQKQNERSAEKFRHDGGGSILFRPVGLSIFFEIYAELIVSKNETEAFKSLFSLPTDVSKYPYLNIIWAGKIVGKNRTLMRDVLLYRLGVSKRPIKELVDKIEKSYPNAKIEDHLGSVSLKPTEKG
jgi:DNA sulfur modification protein DndB